jgi:hypothetical protein
MGLDGFSRYPIALAVGANCLRMPIDLPPSSALRLLMPVTLLPGRLRLATRPRSTGSLAKKTTGIVEVACLAAMVSASGQKWTSPPYFQMFALPLKADITHACHHVG